MIDIITNTMKDLHRPNLIVFFSQWEHWEPFKRKGPLPRFVSLCFVCLFFKLNYCRIAFHFLNFWCLNHFCVNAFTTSKDHYCSSNHHLQQELGCTSLSNVSDRCSSLEQSVEHQIWDDDLETLQVWISLYTEGNFLGLPHSVLIFKCFL